MPPNHTFRAPSFLLGQQTFLIPFMIHLVIMQHAALQSQFKKVGLNILATTAVKSNLVPIFFLPSFTTNRQRHQINDCIQQKHDQTMVLVNGMTFFLLFICQTYNGLHRGTYFQQSVNFFPTYFTTPLRLFPISCTHFRCSLLS